MSFFTKVSMSKELRLPSEEEFMNFMTQLWEYNTDYQKQETTFEGMGKIFERQVVLIEDWKIMLEILKKEVPDHNHENFKNFRTRRTFRSEYWTQFSAAYKVIIDENDIERRHSFVSAMIKELAEQNLRMNTAIDLKVEQERLRRVLESGLRNILKKINKADLDKPFRTDDSLENLFAKLCGASASPRTLRDEWPPVRKSD